MKRTQTPAARQVAQHLRALRQAELEALEDGLAEGAARGSSFAAALLRVLRARVRRKESPRT